MKVAVILDQYSTHDGGAFTFQQELLEALIAVAPESQHEFIVFSQAESPLELGASIAWQRYKRPALVERSLLKLFRYLPLLEDALVWLSSLEYQLRATDVQLVWFINPRLRGVRLPYIPLVLDLQHRLQPQFPEVSAKGEWQRRESHFGRWLPRALAVITGTQTGQDELWRFYKIPAERVIRLPHPTPQAALETKAQDDEAALARLGLVPGYLFYPAQLWSHKNHANLLRALALLKQEGLTLQLVLTGADYGAGKSIHALSESLGLSAQVHMLGFVEQQDLYVLYRNALALTYASFFGPENLPPLEAFAQGCPVIAARVSGSEEQLGEAALLIDPTSPEQIAAGIRRIHSNVELRQQLVQAGRARATAWTAQDFVRGAIGAFDKIARELP
ncbi:MAG TPA: glycosyltransferase family 1 protein [Anaerolineales bacterium]|nr:glycosyltransferase family 1 protein [Anaerolineales bacterium]HRQ92524.1 glycosyltransferase family 1 protein [Anaerolineales bacterium]